MLPFFILYMKQVISLISMTVYFPKAYGLLLRLF